MFNVVVQPFVQNAMFGFGIGDNIQGATGNNNTFVGAGIMEANLGGIGLSIGSNNTLIGAQINNNGVSTGSNLTMIGHDMVCTLSNLAVFGRLDQNVKIGETNPVADNGAALQIVGATGDFTTGNPGSGVGKWKVGKFITAASAFDAAHYLEVMVDGVLRKIALST